jgi:catechol 2,3-dioxygenase-like lactoylglutathione lyase family enzyme
MQIERIDHFTIVAQPAEIERLCEFYCKVLGLAPGPRPDFTFDGYWLYPPTGGPLVHLAAITSRALPEGPHDTGKLDHISFRGTGLHEFRLHSSGGAGAGFSTAPDLLS